MNVEELKNEICAGQFGYTLTTETTPKMNKGGRGGIAVNPLFGRVTKHTSYKNVCFGSYEVHINSALEKEGKEADFTAQKASGRTAINSFISVDDKTGETFYIGFSFYRNTKVESQFFVDGKPATKEELETIKNYLPKPSENKSQGLENPIDYRAIKLENVVAITQGERLVFARHNQDYATAV